MAAAKSQQQLSKGKLKQQKRANLTNHAESCAGSLPRSQAAYIRELQQIWQDAP